MNVLTDEDIVSTFSRVFGEDEISHDDMAVSRAIEAAVLSKLESSFKDSARLDFITKAESAMLVIDASCRIAELEKRCGLLQAKIDALMLEFCPEEMTHEQIEEWASHQVMSASSAESVVSKPELESGKSIKIQGLQINSLTGKC